MKKILLLFTFLFISSFVIQINTGYTATNDQLIIINKTNNKLAFFNNGELVKTFSVGTGRTNELTPEGHFKIVNKIKNRPYYTNNIPGGDPRNPLGDRWLGINARGTSGNVYAIHGNNNPSSIGNYVSAGCVRMHNEEIRWLFDQVKINTPVIILRSNNSFPEIAKANGYQMTPPYQIEINGKLQSFDQDPVIINNRVLAPLRETFESLGATLRWNQETQTITATKEDRNITLKLGSRNATINGQNVTLDVPAQLVNNRTMVPVRFVTEALGATVSVDSQKRLIKINLQTTQPKQPELIPIKVMINNELQSYSQSPFILNGTSMVPLRGIFEKLGATVRWNQETKTITATKDGTNITLVVGSNEAKVNDQTINVSVPAQVRTGTTYVPVRFISESLGARVQWKKDENTVFIFSN
ncbi:stalk domain-containing protein [Anaerobacillus sp. MEB173]|uniref:L,D-transpeptidase family protein n=1 Tax=Anaerobacillus sp. MEB173 TaxID=3383345 RepID=UPI003F8FB02D